MLEKILIVFNPLAGLKYKTGYQESFLKDCQKLLPQAKFDWLITTPNLQEQLAALKLNDYQRLIVIGGDGTVKAVADFLLNNGLDLPLAIIPQGSANVLASALNISLNQKNAVSTACLGKEKRIDVGLLNSQEYFLICLSLGYWSKIIKATGRNLKIRLGFGAYFLTFLKQRQVNKTAFKFILDNQAHEIFGNTLVIANALSFFKLQPITPVDLADGQLEILILKNRSLFGFLNVIWSFFLGKKKFPALFKAKGKKITIYLTEKIANTIQVDGETVRAQSFGSAPSALSSGPKGQDDIAPLQKIEVEIVPEKLKVIV